MFNDQDDDYSLFDHQQAASDPHISFKGRRCAACGRKTTQQFIRLFHCKCGMSFIRTGRGWSMFQRTPDMIFKLTKNKPKHPIIEYRKYRSE